MLSAPSSAKSFDSQYGVSARLYSLGAGAVSTTKGAIASLLSLGDSSPDSLDNRYRYYNYYDHRSDYSRPQRTGFKSRKSVDNYEVFTPTMNWKQGNGFVHFLFVIVIGNNSFPLR
jgi:hypothetical protein